MKHKSGLRLPHNYYRRRIARITEQALVELRTRQQAEWAFQARLKDLHHVSIELSQAGSIDDLCRSAIELGRSRLGFDRLGIWLLDRDPQYMLGTFGTDEQGQLRDERGAHLPSVINFFFTPENLTQHTPVVVRQDLPLRDEQYHAVGTGWTAVAALWDGDQVIGCICADNLLKQQPIEPYEPELLALYGAALGYLCTRLQTEATLRERDAQLLQSQKMEAIGRLAGGIAHDFNNILTVIDNYTDLLLFEARTYTSTALYSIEQIKQVTAQAATLTQQLLAFSRRQSLQPTVLDLNIVVSELQAMLRSLIGDRIELMVQLAQQPLLIQIVLGQLQQVLLNLVINARDAMPDGGRITIETTETTMNGEHARRQTDLDNGMYALLKVSDTGFGMDHETQSRIFEPFFTTKELGRGTGMGLAIVDGIVSQSGGYIRISSTPGRGTIFQVYIPRVIA